MHFSTVALIGRHQDTDLDKLLRRLAQTLTHAGCTVLIEADTSHNTGLTEYPVSSLEEIGQQAHLAVVVGGDGTMLGTARYLAPYKVPLVGVNHGKLGFITDIPLQDAENALSRVLKGDYQAEDRILLKGTIWRGHQKMFSASALNDVVLNRAGRGGMIEVRVKLNGTYMYTQRADGLIVATPTGSTAYALSVNGPILDPGMKAMILVPIAPQTLSNRPIVMSGEGHLTLTLTDTGRTYPAASCHFDMQTWSELQPGDRIVVERAPHTIRLLHPQGYNFFTTLRHKLHWNLMPQRNANAP